jgi:hypothetical protein
MSTDRLPRCCACGGLGRLSMVAVAESTWVWLHPGSCERSYCGGTTSRRQDVAGSSRAPPTPRGSLMTHPLYAGMRLGECVGYIRSNMTDSLGWMKRTLPEST